MLYESLTIDSRGNHTILQRKQCSNCVKRSCCCKAMTIHRSWHTNRKMAQVHAKCALECIDLSLISMRKRAPIQAEITNIFWLRLRFLQRESHSTSILFTIVRGHTEPKSIVGLTIPHNLAIYMRTTSSGMFIF